MVLELRVFSVQTEQTTTHQFVTMAILDRLYSFSVRTGSVLFAIAFVAAGVLYVKQDSLLVSAL
jgi:hypothetical protein